MTRPLILLSNDDGFDAAGLQALHRQLKRFADVIVCAPLTNQSASSHSLTLNDVLRLRRVDEDVFALNGTPADCVYVALHADQRILPRKPDVVVSGMNHGPNLGVDVIYSGTVAAAREAAQRQIPALAVSASTRSDLEQAAMLGAQLAESLSQQPLDLSKPAPLLSLNIPEGNSWPLKATKLGERRYDHNVVFRRDPRSREYLWVGGSDVVHDTDEHTDTAAWDRGHASLTPLTLDMFETTHQPLCASLVAAATATS